MLILLSYCTLAFGQTTQPSSRPSYTVWRYDENYQFLENTSARTDFFDPIKFIPLNKTGDWYVSFGGQLRDRYEHFENYNFGTGPQTSDGYNLARILAYSDLHLGPNLRFFFEGISAFEAGRNGGPRATDVNQLDLEQGFADFLLPIRRDVDLTLRGGRQYLAYGAQRLIGPSDWLNTPHTFDGFRSNLNSPGNELDFFLVRPVLVEPYKFDSSDDNNALAGLYDTLQLPRILQGSHSKLELYTIYLDRQNASFPAQGGVGTESVYSLGTRFSGAPKPFDFDVEGTYQVGSFKDAEINAYSFATKEGYTANAITFHPRIFFGFDIASGGNKNPATIGTFNQLYPSAHGQFGNIDQIGRMNIIDVNPRFDLALLQQVKYVQSLALRTSYYAFWRQSLEDGAYNAAGTLFRAAGTSRARPIGSEIDFLLNWQVDPHLLAYFGYSHFFPGSFIQETGPSNPIDFFYTAVTFTF
jgi:hypothetical protein